MNEHDALLFAEDKGIEDGARGVWSPPFRSFLADEAVKVYGDSYWASFEAATIETEFPNG